MAIKQKQADIPLTTDARRTYPLTCDPEVEALGRDTLAEIRTGARDLTACPGLSPTASWATVRPLSDDEKEAAKAEAGAPPQLGFMVAHYIDEGVEALEGERAKALGRAKAIDALPADERAAFDSLVPWQGEVVLAHARRGLVSIFLGDLDERGAPVVHGGDSAWAAVLGIEDKGMRNRVIAEVGAHVLRLTGLTDEGKA